MVLLNLLAVVVILFIIFIVSTLIRNFPSHEDFKRSENDVAIRRIKENFSKLNSAWKDVPIVLSDKGSYTQDKKFIAMCVKNPDTGVYYDFNTMMYVALHELTHFISPESEQHDTAFMRNFESILKRAYAAGILKPLIPPETYCP